MYKDGTLCQYRVYTCQYRRDSGDVLREIAELIRALIFFVLFRFIAFSSFPIFSALLAVSSQYHGDFCFPRMRGGDPRVARGRCKRTHTGRKRAPAYAIHDIEKAHSYKKDFSFHAIYARIKERTRLY